jgi:hypothetical protein
LRGANQALDLFVGGFSSGIHALVTGLVSRGLPARELAFYPADRLS